jgi:hypothetical protein
LPRYRSVLAPGGRSRCDATAPGPGPGAAGTPGDGRRRESPRANSGNSPGSTRADWPGGRGWATAGYPRVRKAPGSGRVRPAAGEWRPGASAKGGRGRCRTDPQGPSRAARAGWPRRDLRQVTAAMRGRRRRCDRSRAERATECSGRTAARRPGPVPGNSAGMYRPPAPALRSATWLPVFLGVSRRLQAGPHRIPDRFHGSWRRRARSNRSGFRTGPDRPLRPWSAARRPGSGDPQEPLSTQPGIDRDIRTSRRGCAPDYID